MTVYNIQSPNGRIIKVEGDTRPTEKELDEIFAARGSINQNALKNVKSSAEIPGAGELFYENHLSKWEQAKQYAENRPQWQKGMSWIEYTNMVKKYDAKFGIEPAELNPLKAIWKNSVTNSPLVEITSKPFRRQKEKRASKYVDNSHVITEIPIEAQADWLKKGEMKAGEAFMRSDWSRAVPFVGSLNTFTELFDIKNILDKYNKGEELNAIEIKKLNAYILDVAEQNYRGISFGGKFIQGALELPSFMGEFIATNGAAAIGKNFMQKTVTKGLQNATQKQIGKRLTKGLIESGAGAVTRTFLGMPMRVAENYGSRRIAEGLHITDKGQVATETMGEAPAKTFLKAWGDAVIENWSEEMGEGIMEGFGIAGKTLIPRGARARFLKAVRKYRPDTSINEFMTKAGYNGIIGELSEERAGDVIRAVFNLNDQRKDNGTPMNTFERILDALTPDKEQWLLELGLFSIPGAMSYAGNRVAHHLRNKGLSEYEIQDYMHYSSELEKEKLLAEISDKKVSDILNNLDEKELQTKSEIENNVIELAKNAGVEEIKASAAAQILSNRAMAVSKLYNIDAKEWYNNLKLDIKKDNAPVLKGGIEKTVSQNGQTYNQIAYHGSPHRFDKFSLGHIGTGQGAQTYGWGLYFSGNKKISESYRKTLAEPEIYYSNQRIAKSDDKNLFYYIRDNGKCKTLNDFNKYKRLKEKAYNLSTEYAELERESLKIDVNDSAYDELYNKFLEKEIQSQQAETELSKFLEKTSLPLPSIRFNVDELIEKIKKINVKKIKFTQGQLYEVDIPDDDVLLDWYKTIGHMPVNIVNKIKSLENFIDEKHFFSVDLHETGEQVYNNLSEYLGSDKAASTKLNELGIKGIKYLDASSRKYGKGSYNYVIFDDNAINILNTFYQNQEQPKGAVEFSNNENVIKLFETADESTLLHELGHLFLQDLINTASYNEKALEDLSLVNDWLGYNGVEYTKAQHEKFARGFESYVMSGKAPTSFLETVFKNFKEWLKNIYKSVNELGVVMSDEAYKVYDRLFASERNTSDIEKINDIVNKAIEHSQRNNGKLTEWQKDYKKTAYTILSIATKKDISWLKMQLEGNQNIKGKGKRAEYILEAIRHMDDELTDYGFVYDWHKYFKDYGSSYENDEGNDEELAMAAYEVIINKTYLDKPDEYDELNYYEKQYQFILDLYKKTQGEARDYPMAAMCFWFEKVDEYFRPLFEERFEADVKDIDRFEHLDKYEQAKERILKNIDKLKNYDKNKEFENVIKSALSAVDFLTAKDKQRLFYNFLDLKTVDDLKNNIDEIMDISKCMEDLNYRKILDEKIQKELKYTKNIKSGKHEIGRFDYKTNKIFEQLRIYNKLTQEQAQTELADIEFDEEKTLSFEEKLRNKFLTYKANGNIYLSSDLIHSLYEDIISLKIAGRFAKKEMELEKKTKRQNNINELLSILNKKNKTNILAKSYVPLLANWESALNLIFNGEIKDRYSLLNIEADVQNYAYKHKLDFQKAAFDCYNLKSNDNLENLGISNFDLDNKILENLAEEYQFTEKVEGENFPVTLNKMQIINIYIANKNDLSHDRLINQFGIIQLNSILSKLDEGDKKFGDLLQRTAAKFYLEINKVFIQKYGIELPKVKNYFPSVAEHISEIDLYNDYVERSTVPSFIKSRINNDNVTLKFGNPVQTLFSHIDKTSRFIKMTERLDTLNHIFKNKKVARKITEIYGEDTYKSLLQMLTNSSYTVKGAVYDGWSGIFNKLLNNWVVTKIAVKPTIMIKQLLSVFNYAGDMPVSDWGKGFINAVSHPKQTINFMMKDEYIKTRFQSGSQSEYLKETIKSLEFAKTKKLADFFTLSVRIGDIGAVVFGGKPYVDYLMKEKGLSEKEAFQEFRLVTMRSQQASVSSSLSNFQNNNSNPLARTIFAFRNTSNQYMRKVADSIISFSHGEITKTQLAKNLFIYTFFNTFLYKTATSLSILRLLMTGDDDDLINDIATSIFDLNAVAIPLLGDAYQYALSKLTGESKHHSSIPALNEIYTCFDKLKKEDFAFEDFLYIINNLVEIGTGVPANALTNTLGGISDIAHGGFIGGTLRVLGYSDRRAGLTTGAIEIKKHKLRKKRKKRKIKRYI